MIDSKDLEPLRDQLRVQGGAGNWNYDEYMHGMFNGMECALATLEGREPDFRSRPLDGWLRDKATAAAALPTEASNVKWDN